MSTSIFSAIIKESMHTNFAVTNSIYSEKMPVESAPLSKLGIFWYIQSIIDVEMQNWTHVDK